LAVDKVIATITRNAAVAESLRMPIVMLS